MGDRPKPYIRGKKNQACCSLIDHLKTLGVDATVGHDNKRPKATLYAYVMGGKTRLVPKEWKGFPVIAVFTGVIRPCAE